MVKAYLASLPGTLFSNAQRKALDAIGAALKQRSISFKTAVELSGLVKQDKVQEAREQLESARK